MYPLAKPSGEKRITSALLYLPCYQDSQFLSRKFLAAYFSALAAYFPHIFRKRKYARKLTIRQICIRLIVKYTRVRGQTRMRVCPSKTAGFGRAKNCGGQKSQGPKSANPRESRAKAVQNPRESYAKAVQKPREGRERTTVTWWNISLKECFWVWPP
jgi:hypothetical protein